MVDRCDIFPCAYLSWLLLLIILLSLSPSLYVYRTDGNRQDFGTKIHLFHDYLNPFLMLSPCKLPCHRNHTENNWLSSFICTRVVDLRQSCLKRQTDRQHAVKHFKKELLMNLTKKKNLKLISCQKNSRLVQTQRDRKKELN